MPQIEFVNTATATEADFDDEVLNPDNDSDGQIICVYLKLDGVTVDMGTLYDAFNTQYGTVTSDKVSARNCYHLTLST